MFINTLIKKSVSLVVIVSLVIISSGITSVALAQSSQGCYGSIQIDATNNRTGEFASVNQYTGAGDNPYRSMNVEPGDTISIYAYASPYPNGSDCVMAGSTLYTGNGATFDNGMTYYSISPFPSAYTTLSLGTQSTDV
ncbi:MAG: hypothetical protein M3Q64_00500, partial [bacterium]|nr:hypothetical protein [bacterium]